MGTSLFPIFYFTVAKLPYIKGLLDIFNLSERHMSCINCKLMIVLALMVMISDRAYGYLDPGTGSIIIQLVVAGALGAMFTVKNSFRNIKEYAARIFRGRAKKETTA